MKLFYLHKLILLIALISITQILSAHNGTIQGTVSDRENSAPIEGALIELVETNTTTITNQFGLYTFTDLPEGNYTISISSLGFKTVTESVSVNNTRTTELITLLAQTPIELTAVTIQNKNQSGNNTVTALDIKLRPTENAQDILRLVPGLFIAQHAGGGKAEQIFLRGFDIDHGTDISVNVDGIPVNMVSHAHGQGYADLHFVIPETINSFDFEKGPYNAQYGDFTTAAFVNFKTANTINKSMLKVSAGQYNTARTLLMLDLLDNTKSQSAYVAGEYYISDGPFTSPQDFVRLNLFGKYHTKISDDKILSITLSTFKSQWNASGQIPLRAIESGEIDRFGAIDDTEGGFTGRTNVNFEFTKLLSNKSSFKNQFYYSRYNFELYSNFTFFLEDSINGDMIKQKEKRNIYGYNSIYSNDGIIGSIKVNSKIGFGLRYDQVMENELSHVKNRSILLDRLAYGNIYQTNANVFISETFQLTKKLSINAAARIDFFNFSYDDLMDSIYNYTSVDDNIATYKLNFDYQLSQNALVYLHNGKGFHSNDTRVVTAQNAIQTLPAAYGSDLGIKFKPYKNLILNPAVWILYLDQEFVYVGDAAVVEAGGKSLRKGFDLSARLQITKWLFLDGDINYTLAEAIGEPENANFIPLAPDLTSIGGITFKLRSGINGSFRYRYMDDRPANEDGSVIAEGYLVNDLVINYTQKQYEFGIEIQNLFNVDWNEAQFDTESRLEFEPEAVSELHFTPGTPFFIKGSFSYFF